MPYRMTRARADWLALRTAAGAPARARPAHGVRRVAQHLRAVREPAPRELVAVGAVQPLKIGRLRRVPRHVGRRTPADSGPRPCGRRSDARLAQVGEGGGHRLREVRPLLYRREVGQLTGGDQAPKQALAGEARERRRRRPAHLGDQVGGQAPERDHRDVGDGVEPPHQKVADVRPHVR